jgi:hypothetical protein
MRHVAKLSHARSVITCRATTPTETLATHGVSIRSHICRSRSVPDSAMYDPVGQWTAQTSAGPYSSLNTGSDMMMTSGTHDPEALGEDSPEAESMSTAGNGDELQRQGEPYTGRHRTGLDDRADGPDSAQPSA